MRKLKRVVATTDLSPVARRAAERAALIAKDTGAALELLHAVDIAPLERLRGLVAETIEALQQRVLGAAQERLQGQVSALRHRYGLNAGTHVATGVLPNVLADGPATVAADLLVCGARGEGHARRPLLGSTAERLVGTARCPVLVVKQAAHRPYETLLVPIDFSSSSARTIKLARSVAPHADIVLLHVFEVPFELQLHYANVDENIIDHYRIGARQDALDQLHRIAEKTGLDAGVPRFVVLQGYPAARIVEQAQELHCDLIVMGRRGTNALGELLVGGVTQRVLAESRCDVLVSA